MSPRRPPRAAGSGDPGSRRLVGRYRLDAELGRGAMGTVWSAYDEVLHRPVAVKEVRLSLVPVGERAVVRERTLREARATAMLSHPNVVTLYDVVEVDSEPYVVMELLPSRSLAAHIADHGHLGHAETAEIGAAVASALVTAHRAGITHRDVKPGNVLIGGDGQIKLTDFGIARNAAESSMTQTGTVLGSPPYIAPEVAMGRGVGPAADLWGLGATLFACLEGRPPYDGGNPVSTVSAVVHGDVPLPVGRGPVVDVIRGLMVKDPTLRMPLQAVRRRLRPLLADPEGPLLSTSGARPADESTLPHPGPAHPATAEASDAFDASDHAGLVPVAPLSADPAAPADGAAEGGDDDAPAGDAVDADRTPRAAVDPATDDPPAHDLAAHDLAAHDLAAHDLAAHDPAAHDPAADDPPADDGAAGTEHEPDDDPADDREAVNRRTAADEQADGADEVVRVTDPTVAEPTPAEPTPAEPTPAEPTPAEPTPAEPTPAGPTVTEQPGGVSPVAETVAEVPAEDPADETVADAPADETVAEDPTPQTVVAEDETVAEVPAAETVAADPAEEARTTLTPTVDAAETSVVRRTGTGPLGRSRPGVTTPTGVRPEPWPSSTPSSAWPASRAAPRTPSAPWSAGPAAPRRPEPAGLSAPSQALAADPGPLPFAPRAAAPTVSRGVVVGVVVLLVVLALLGALGGYALVRAAGGQPVLGAALVAAGPVTATETPVAAGLLTPGRRVAAR